LTWNGSDEICETSAENKKLDDWPDFVSFLYIFSSMFFYFFISFLFFCLTTITTINCIELFLSDYRGVPPNPATATFSTNYTATTGVDTGTRRRLFAGFRPMSGFGLLRMRSSQNRSISLPESNNF
jgi:hypothetical protein